MRALLCLAVLAAAFGVARAQTVVRVGLFPNVTHAQALVAKNLSSEGQGWFEKRLGPGTKIEWFVYNAGPSAMEAIFARSIDFTYVGPSPAVNAYARANGRDIRIVAGAMRGGDALVVRGEAIAKIEDFRGKAIATPQLGNTQDVACRAWLIKNGIRVTLVGGDARVLPTENPDMLALFEQGKLDAAWTVEPWVSRLLSEAKGRIFFEPEDSVTTVLAGREEFLKTNPGLAQAFVAAHRELTQWIRDHPEEAQQRVRNELSALTRKEIPLELIQRAWTRLRFDDSISREPFEAFLDQARLVGFLRAKIDLSNLIWNPR
ncbi:MAG TPA: ABC transporter substrate-binding protein [Terrimicrobiaceae bacterium]|jgi:NitT/TauT family transport system substrate-binding protein|nr:ABC transporter substrate-binding protein [Terrimicrobiaceae bacterium]